MVADQKSAASNGATPCDFPQDLVILLLVSSPLLFNDDYHSHFSSRDWLVIKGAEHYGATATDM